MNDTSKDVVRKDEHQNDNISTRDAKTSETKQGEADERLDEALEETFPSSDPVSVKITK